MAGIRQRTKRAGLPPTQITRQWVQRQIEKGACAATGITFELADGIGPEKVNPYTPSADRIDPRKGYTYQNTQIVCWAYNRAKGEYSDRTFKYVASSYLEAEGYTVEEPSNVG